MVYAMLFTPQRVATTSFLCFNDLDSPDKIILKEKGDKKVVTVNRAGNSIVHFKTAIKFMMRTSIIILCR